MNKVILSGRLVNDPDSRTTSNGTNTCSFRLAVNRRQTNAQGQREADFFQVVCWKGLADIVCKYLAKGRQCIVEGRLQTRQYDAQDGSKRYVTEVIAEEVEFVGNKHEETTAPATAPAQGFMPVEDEDLPF